MKYWDSSALVPVVVAEATTAQVRAWIKEDRTILTWWGTGIECLAALARKSREQSLAPQDLNLALAKLRKLETGWIEVEPSPALREGARRLLRIHSLRAADALQLAAAIIGAEQRSQNLSFVCYDQRLRTAANLEGFALLPAMI